jgi:hypothetical protein
MTTKFFTLVTVIGFAGVCIAQAQSPSPAESPAQSPTPAKHRASTKAQAAASPAASPATSPKAKPGSKKAAATAAASPAASPSPAKFNLGDLFKPKTSAAAASPAAASPARGASTGAATKAPAAGGGHGLVWVNPETHVYHREGSRFYGTTKKGKYMTEAEAIKEGNKAAAKGL